jgi:hypothetical protein
MEPKQLVKQVFYHLFSAHPDHGELWDSLHSCAENESPRVQLAILKLSEGDPEKLLHYVQAARIDYRDVLAWAEYPEQLRSGKTRFNASLDEYEAMLERDRRQYESWLDSFRATD